ncbi:MAG TPA: hypothetical protein VF120_01705 [Ktedonobacterales bacterium]
MALKDDLRDHTDWETAFRTVGSMHHTLNGLLGRWWLHDERLRAVRWVADEAREHTCIEEWRPRKTKADLLLADGNQFDGVADAEGSDYREAIYALAAYLAERDPTSPYYSIRFGICLAYKGDCGELDLEKYTRWAQDATTKAGQPTPQHKEKPGRLLIVMSAPKDQEADTPSLRLPRGYGYWRGTIKGIWASVVLDGVVIWGPDVLRRTPYR